MPYRSLPGVCIVVLVLAIAAAGCTAAPAEPDAFNRTLDALTLEEKIGQMLMVGFRGSTVDADSQIARDIAAGRIGGVILFDRDVALGSNERNIKDPGQVRALTAELQGYAATIPLFIAVDQEGGKVCRLKEAYGYPPTVAAAVLGGQNNETATRAAGRSLAAMVRESGCNLNFAPVVDLNVTADSPAIGKLGRSFSADPDVVAANAGWIIDEHHAEGVMTAIKHFPGHGSALADTHAGFTDVTATWTEEELLPYRTLIDRNLPDMVMTAHVYNANLDPDYPATLSHATVTGILRERLGYDGVVVTDAMDMGAIHDNYDLEESLRLSINAGCDIFLFANNLVYDEAVAEKAVGIVKSLVAEGKISEERIDESCTRILRLKMRHLDGNWTAA
ncbi:glycoside hydrolase family 3 [Methanoculleus sp. FWC-SCC1]|uniref:beta-N-acetylhexosaminidase n=1 Tax=Methanoculleus frigidifontis TaxID=2584085 RepID=A0ABT8M7C5_9EURY|nr:glycoside hydrolase family 3 N-terminal domain-containing protein [Methanoculleus sp. FWC-SCC1]MDN7023826.1 glycoside hydrolase family 3 [Methanoculleus sp. FWC-SCC1]